MAKKYTSETKYTSKTKYTSEQTSARDMYLSYERGLIGIGNAMHQYVGTMRRDSEKLFAYAYAYFAAHGQDSVTFADIRRLVSSGELEEIMALKGSHASDDLIGRILNGRKRISRLEYLQVLLASYCDNAMDKARDRMIEGFEKIVAACIPNLYQEYAGRPLDMPAGDVRDVADEIISKKTEYGTANQQVKKVRTFYGEFLEKTLPQIFARELSQKAAVAMSDKMADKIETRLKAVARTLGNTYYNRAIKRVASALGVKEYEYCAILDERTSEICRGLNGKIFSFSLAQPGVNYPPMHPNCRSMAIPKIPRKNEQDSKNNEKEQKQQL